MAQMITREQIKERLDSRTPTTIIEALPQSYFDTGHLPGAINLPHDEVREKAPQMLPDKDAFIVVYCANAECRNSAMAAETLRHLGYTQVHEYPEGKKHWREANFPVESTI